MVLSSWHFQLSISKIAIEQLTDFSVDKYRRELVSIFTMILVFSDCFLLHPIKSVDKKTTPSCADVVEIVSFRLDDNEYV